VGGARRFRKLWVDGGYQAEWLGHWVRALKHSYKIDLEITTTALGFRWSRGAGQWSAPLPGCSMIVAIAGIMNG